jgi:hypothetical protein
VCPLRMKTGCAGGRFASDDMTATNKVQLMGYLLHFHDSGRCVDGLPPILEILFNDNQNT